MAKVTPMRKFSSFIEHSPFGGSEGSALSFKQWHRRMQTEHEILHQAGKIGFGLWNWCRYPCIPCRWLDSIEYEFKICKCCFKFKTLKMFGTLFLILVFVYTFMYGRFGNEMLPGGTIFFFFLVSLLAYIVGFSLMYVGLPPIFGNLLAGLVLGNLPKEWLPPYDEQLLHEIVSGCEKILVIIALIRAGLLLDLSRIKTRVQFILKISFIPLLIEFSLIFAVTHLLTNLPWEWSALQGSVLCIGSLASLTTIMEKNKQSGFGEDKHLSTVLIAASAVNVGLGTTLYVICLSYIFPIASQKEKWWLIFFNVLEEIALGVAAGFLSGLLVGFFPDKRNKDAPALRILVIGTGAFGIASVLDKYNMAAGGLIGALTLSLTACNMWEELGWHESNNPVHYFYSMVFFYGQPVTLAQLGFTMNFWKRDGKEIGLSFAVIVIGIVAREIFCFLSTMGKFYPTTVKEKIFICLAWLSKGTFEAVLAFAVESMTLEKKDTLSDSTYERYVHYTQIIQQTTILAILFTTPFITYSLTLLSPVLLTRREYPPTPSLV